MTNVKTAICAPVTDLPSGLRHSLGIMASSLVIRALILAIRAYQLMVSPVLAFLIGPGGGCRFRPSCSQYAADAIRSQGPLTGGWLAVKRICRRHPWGDCGHDPAPDKELRIPRSELHI